jgi:hypothetical protein
LIKEKTEKRVPEVPAVLHENKKNGRLPGIFN